MRYAIICYEDTNGDFRTLLLRDAAKNLLKIG